ncbi:serine threonine-protein kinase ulk4 [Limosa lapponica baueri]|uniref:Serine threonine-protein kinase ulk4 n=1 Tax=Limosa lapponica baueri TaxID=1758121 RepID=A0A2I0TWU0_LIMLA|nr:serine threonine-protein kinase ulk4 [Limosa lapponica baueri]
MIADTSGKISYNQDSLDTKGHIALVTQSPALQITSNEKRSESLKNDGDALIQTLESLARTASSHADVAVASLAFEILRTVGRENVRTTK